MASKFTTIRIMAGALWRVSSNQLQITGNIIDEKGKTAEEYKDERAPTSHGEIFLLIARNIIATG